MRQRAPRLGERLQGDMVGRCLPAARRLTTSRKRGRTTTEEASPIGASAGSSVSLAWDDSVGASVHGPDGRCRLVIGLGFEPEPAVQ
jgi:hypothetical protein